MDIKLVTVAVPLIIGGIGVWMKVADRSLTNRWWSRLGTTLILTGVVLLGAFFLGAFGVQFRSPIVFSEEQSQEAKAQLPNSSDSPRPISVIGKTFRNERVPLDGHLYTDCTFENVTFVYNGGYLGGFLNNRIVRPIGFASDNPAVSETVHILRGLGYIKPGINIPPSEDNRVEEPRYE